jgi:hypothetical protein
MSPTAKKAAAPAPETEEHLPVDGRTMRHLHGLLTAHGIPTADKGRHDYLSAEVGRPITSASELTRTESARLFGSRSRTGRSGSSPAACAGTAQPTGESATSTRGSQSAGCAGTTTTSRP